jgi:hypothetical protein
MKLKVICPTRSRPDKARELLTSFRATADARTSSLVFYVDEDDPQLDAYLELPNVRVRPSQGGMVATLNLAAREITDSCLCNKYLGFVGDDHRFRTAYWDRSITEVLDKAGGGFAYGNDKFWPNGEIPTQIFMSSTIVRRLGWMGLPTCKHLYIDNVWRTLGEATDSLYYLPDVIVEHMHPAGGKAEWDEQYRRLNSEERYTEDRMAFEEWLETKASDDIKRVNDAITCAPRA